MGDVIFIRGQRQSAVFAETVPISKPRLPNVRRMAGYVAVTGIGLTIGLLLGTIAALMLGLIALC